VPCSLIDTDYSTIKGGKRTEVAPTILELLSDYLLKEMTGDIPI
jgi:hypothetical protein